MTRIGYPRSALTALLDGLERELLSAHADEVRDALRETGRTHTIACLEVRALLNEASPRAKTALRRRRGLTRAPEPDWIGFSAFRESFGLGLAAIPTPASFLDRATVGTKGGGPAL